MVYYKAIFRFSGNGYLGWQKQKDFGPTIQGAIEKRLADIFKGGEIKTIGSGRTDTGVHSLSHTVKIQAPFKIEPPRLVAALNSGLPGNIECVEAEYCEQDFRPTNDAIKKEYRYLFTTSKRPSPFQTGLIANCPYDLNFEKMRRASRLFIGQKDFLAFSCVGSDPSTTVRTIFELEISEGIEPNFQGILPRHHMIRVVGDGFLKQMVRLIVGSLWQVGRGKIEEEAIERAFEKAPSHRLGEVAPAEGLYKSRTWY